MATISGFWGWGGRGSTFLTLCLARALEKKKVQHGSGRDKDLSTKSGNFREVGRWEHNTPLKWFLHKGSTELIILHTLAQRGHFLLSLWTYILRKTDHSTAAGYCEKFKRRNLSMWKSLFHRATKF